MNEAITRHVGLYETLKADLCASDPAASPGLWSIISHLGDPGFRAVLLYRFAAYFFYKGKLGKSVAICLKSLNLLLNGCEMHPEAIIAPGLSVPHPAGVEIGTVRMGRNVTVMQKVTLRTQNQVKPSENHGEWAMVEENVYFSPGAVMIGSIHIGESAYIGPNALVNSDVPPFASAAGVPAIITIQSANQYSL